MKKETIHFGLNSWEISKPGFFILLELLAAGVNRKRAIVFVLWAEGLLGC